MVSSRRPNATPGPTNTVDQGARTGQAPLVAAVAHTGGGAADLLLAEFAGLLRERGLRVRGLVQQRVGEGKAGVVLVDLGTGCSFSLFQDLGRASTSCSLDTVSLSSATAVLHRAIEERADVVFANRFGAQEAEGRGLAPQMLAVMAEGIPLITIVSDAYLPAWRRLTDGVGLELPDRLEALDDWFAGNRPGTNESPR